MEAVMGSAAADVPASQPARRMVVLLGVPVDALTMDEALDRIEGLVEQGRRTGRSHQIATVNADFLVHAVNDPEVRAILQEADLATMDGMPVVWGARLLGVPSPGRVTGADLVPLLAERAAARGYSIYLLGAAPGVADKAAALLQAQYPGLKIAGVFSPPVGPVLAMDPSIAERIKQARPDILLVAFGNPKQEKWIAMQRYNLGVPVMMGVGGTLDFITGNMARAPRWMQNSGLEWLYRLGREPRRLWRRYGVDFGVFGWFMLRQLWVMRRMGRPSVAAPLAETAVLNGVGRLRAQGTLTFANLAAFQAQAAELTAQTTTLVVDLSAVDFIDSAVVGMLVHLTRDLRAVKGELYVVGAQPKIVKALELLNLTAYLTLRDRLEDVLYPGEVVRGADPAQGADPLAANRPASVILDGQTWAVVKLPPRFDAGSADRVRQDCLDGLEHSPNLLLDFTGTTLLASAGLAVLADLHRRTQLTGQLRLTGVGKDVLRVLQLIHFDRFLKIN